MTLGEFDKHGEPTNKLNTNLCQIVYTSNNNYSNYIQLYTNMYKIYTKYQAAAAWPGPEAPAKGRPGHVGLAGDAWYFVYILYTYIYIYVYIVVYFCL